MSLSPGPAPRRGGFRGCEGPPAPPRSLASGLTNAKEFFEASLEGICDGLNLSDDVAGATFMAAGGSAPELCTSLLGVFVASSDIGFGTIVGSAVFNVLFVIAACAFVTPGLQLTWWPLARDCSCYCLCIISLVIVLVDGKVDWWEGLRLLIGYGCYIVVMANNARLEEYVSKAVKANVRTDRPHNFCYVLQEMIESNAGIMLVYVVILVNLVATVYDNPSNDPDAKEWPYWMNLSASIFFIIEMLVKIYAYGFFGYWAYPLNTFDGALVVLVVLELAILNSLTAGVARSLRVMKFIKVARLARAIRLVRYFQPAKEDFQVQVHYTDISRTMDMFHIDEDETLTHEVGVQCDMSHMDPAKGVGAFLDEDVTVKDLAEAVTEAKIDPVQPEAFKKADSFDGGTTAVERSGPSNLSHVARGYLKGDAAIRPVIRKSIYLGPGGISGDSSIDAGLKALRRGSKMGSEAGSDDEEEPFDPFDVPETALGRFYWGILLPISLLFYCTIPDCRREGWEKWYLVTFFMCVIYIGAAAYVMVSLATTIGYTLGIDETIMGLTFLAAGTSVPDMLSSLAVAKRGHGDMAVSSSIGSNIFDLNFGLALPWFLYAVINGEPAVVKSKGLPSSTLLLFLMVGLTVTMIHFTNWSLSRSLGYSLMLMYAIFLTISICLERDLIA